SNGSSKSTIGLYTACKWCTSSSFSGTLRVEKEPMKSSMDSSCGENTGLSSIPARCFLKYRIARRLANTTVRSPGFIFSRIIRSASSFKNGFTMTQNYQRIIGKKGYRGGGDSDCPQQQI